MQVPSIIQDSANAIKVYDSFCSMHPFPYTVRTKILFAHSNRQMPEVDVVCVKC